MGKYKLVAIGVFVLIVIGAGTALFGNLRPRKAALFIDASPVAMVLVNGEQVGRTPYDGTYSPGEVVIKLIPQGEEPLVPFETKVKLESGIKTVIRRDFGVDSDLSGGEIISFEKVGSNAASVSIVSTPDGVEIFLDGAPKGFTPLKIRGVSAGEHQLVAVANGYYERGFSIKAQEDYKLTVVVDLALDPTYVEEEKKKKNEEEKLIEEVEISETPTGYLRMREEPNTDAQEVGKVTPGFRHVLLEDNGKGWYRIESDGLEGWVSSEYASRVGSGDPSVEN